MKTVLIFAFVLGTFSAALAQAQPTTGTISYEVMQKIDLSRMRVVINGQQLQPGSPDFPADVPDVRTFEQKLLFAGNYAKEVREGGNAGFRISVGPGGSESRQVRNVGSPFEEVTFLDMANQQSITVLSIKEENDTKNYRTDKPIQKVSGWQEASQTKKIAGYTCHKATVPHRNETYTVWYTTDLPFTYSPIRELTPEKGVVLLVESQRESFKAIKIDPKATVSEKDVQPTPEAQLVTSEQLQDLRKKAMADFRSKTMSQFERN
jgi:hypothetical protein